jgi:hypothetical protein
LKLKSPQPDKKGLIGFLTFIHQYNKIKKGRLNFIFETASSIVVSVLALVSRPVIVCYLPDEMLGKKNLFCLFTVCYFPDGTTKEMWRY